MPVVQATLSFLIEFREFHNVDLYHRGYYQVRSYVKATNLRSTSAAGSSGTGNSSSTSKPNPILVETPIIWGAGKKRNLVPESIKDAYVKPGSDTPTNVPEKMCTKTLRIMYREESVSLSDVFEQRILLNLDPCNVEDSLAAYELYLHVELWFAEECYNESTVLSGLENVYERRLRIHFNPSRGINHHFDVFFDYFHLCAVEMAIHGALTNISPTFILLWNPSPSTPLSRSASQRDLAQQSWHSILFDVRNQKRRIQLAHSIHQQVCHLLLAARESMLTFWREVHLCLPGKGKRISDFTDFPGKLQRLSEVFQALASDEDLANQLSLDVSCLSSENTATLKHLCHYCIRQTKVAIYMRHKAHQITMKRLSEAFFCHELSINDLLAVYDPNTTGHEIHAQLVRQSPYFNQLPSLPIWCRELDGVASSLPIIFEDVFVSPAHLDTTDHPPLTHDSPSRAKLDLSIDSQASKPNEPPVAPTRGDSRIILPNRISSSIMSDSIAITEPIKDESIKHIKASPPDDNDLPNMDNTVLLPPMIRQLSNSSPTLADLGIPRAAVSLPPVLRYIGHVKRRFRPKSHLRRRSVDLQNPQFTAIPDMQTSPSVKLLGYRNLTTDDDNAFSFAAKTSLLNDPESSQFIPPLVIQDRRVRSAYNLYSMIDSENSVRSECADPRVVSSCPSSTCHRGSKKIHRRTPTSALFRNYATMSTSDCRRTPPRDQQTIALGTLSNPPTKPPGGHVPQMNEVSTWDGRNSIPVNAIVQSHSLSSISMPNLLVNSSTLSVPQSTLVHAKPPDKRFQPIERFRSRKSRGRSRKRSQSLGYGTYSTELAVFGSCSELMTSVHNASLKPTTDHRHIKSDSSSPTHPSKRLTTCINIRSSQPSSVPSSTHRTLDPDVVRDRTGTSKYWVNHCFGIRPSKSSEEKNSDNDDEMSSHPEPMLHGDIRHRSNPSVLFATNSDTDLSKSNPAGSGVTKSKLIRDSPPSDILNDRTPVPTQEMSINEWLLSGVTDSDYRRVYPDQPPHPNNHHPNRTSLISRSSDHTLPHNSDCYRPLGLRRCSSSTATDQLVNCSSLVKLVDPIVVDFLQLKEHVKRQLALDYFGHVYSDFAIITSPYPCFSEPILHTTDVHLVVCVHGLDGNSSDLRLVRTYLQFALPDCRLEFLMSECNQSDTFADFDTLRVNLVDEILNFLSEMEEPANRISFIGHSMGCVLVRAALVDPRFEPYWSKLHTFLSLSGPHLGTVYNPSGLVNMGMWMMQKWKKSQSLSQLRLRDDPNLRNSYMYRLSTGPGLELFRYVLLVSSPQDRYVPYHSTRIELCRAAIRDNSPLGRVYMEMVTNILHRLVSSARTTVVRYDVHYAVDNSASSLIGRAAHIAVLDSEVFLQKFIYVSAAKYFR